jgi:eukaryotic-like serine/threonine-protein kinase
MTLKAQEGEVVKISKSQWRELEPLLNRGMEMSVDARRVWLDALPDTEPSSKELIPQLRALFAAHDTAEQNSQLNTLAKDTIAPANPAPVFAEGNTIGGYRLVRLVGRGGMGEVWLADQVDGRVQRQVALKLPTRVQHLDVWRRRFDRERDILAKLSHPHIARLYDAGVDQTLARIGLGQPYLALEYVEGVPLSHYADEKKLSITDRLRLFQQVLSAVSHAHAHLVIHRDLKPSNIVVTGDGQVKLLDFGIAKLIDPAETATAENDDDLVAVDATELTALGGRVMTLRYAAPEQVDGESVSAVSDVYALGVILYELVAGISPYAAVQDGKRLTARNMRESEIRLPSVALTKMSLSSTSATQESIADNRQQRSLSQLARSISGDIDAIALKALQREPLQRYTSVAALDEDVQRHLEGSPVRAREGTWRYLLTRFVARNKLAFAAASLVFLAIATGLVMAERERRVALAEKARAEKHFASVRALANTYMLDVYDKLEQVGGTLEARKLLVATSLKYLDSIANEIGRDSKLALEVASGYRKIATLEGDIFDSNLGQTSRAKEYAAKSAQILEELILTQAENMEALRELRQVLMLQSRLSYADSDGKAVGYMERSIEIATRAAALTSATPRERRAVSAAYGEAAHMHSLAGGDSAKAKLYSQRSVEGAEANLKEEPTNLAARNNYSAILQRAGNIEVDSNEPDRIRTAVSYFQRARVMDDTLVQDFPDKDRFRQTRDISMYGLAGALDQLDQRAEAKVIATQTLASADAAYRKDASDAQKLAIYHLTLARLAEIELGMKQYEVALKLVEKLNAEHSRLSANLRDGAFLLDAHASGQWVLAKASCALASGERTSQAARLAMYERAMRAFQSRLDYVNGQIAKNEATPQVRKALANAISARDTCKAEYEKLKAR